MSLSMNGQTYECCVDEWVEELLEEHAGEQSREEGLGTLDDVREATTQGDTHTDLFLDYHKRERPNAIGHSGSCTKRAEGLEMTLY